MDERVDLLGNRAAADRPVWALRYLGEVPVDPIERQEWTRRAGAAAAYREERGYQHETDAIGPAPDRGSPEQRASWHAAYTALHMPEQNRHIAAATDGQLWAWRDAYARETAWAPPYVADDLRDAHLAEDTYRADAVRAWHRAGAATDPAEQARIRQEAEQSSALAQEVTAYREVLTEIADARRRWHVATETSRQQALLADTELRRRHPDAELLPLHPGRELGPAEEVTVSAQSEPTANQAEQHIQPGNGRPQVHHDITAALAAARQAERILSEHRQAGRESDDVVRRREADAKREAEARRSAVRQEPAPNRTMAPELEEEAELEAGR